MIEFYVPTADQLARLSGPWCASFSGGKDSTSLVTWLEWLRRTGQIDAPQPKLVQSDTGVEYPLLDAVARELKNRLTASGWECALVTPRIHEKLYNRILGLGLPPIHPGGRKMRWCTRSTKIDPMERWRKANASGLVLTGLRLGESAIRDEKILARGGCAAGGECGIPEPNENTYSPLLHWSTCQVLDWLNGYVSRDVASVLSDIIPITRKLVDVYNARIGPSGFGWEVPEITMGRFGCIGCPAISATAMAPRATEKRDGIDSPLNELYDMWMVARRRDNRLVRIKEGQDGRGPIKMAVRPMLLARVLDIQRRAGVVLVGPEDEVCIRQCWAEKRYPRGWSEADEDTLPPPLPLFADVR